MSANAPPGEPGASAAGFVPTPAKNPGADAPGSPRKRRLLLSLPLVALVGLVVWYAFLRGPSDDLGRMQGDWAIKGADGRDRGFVRIDGDRWTYHSGGQERASHRIALNPAAKEIDLTALEADGTAKTFTRGAKGVEMKEVGFYALAGDELRISKTPAWNGGNRPAKLDDPDAPALTLVRVTK